MARRLAGEQISYLDEVERCYGVRPQHVDEERFAEAHASLDTALPGSGSLADRYADWLERAAAPREQLADAVVALAAAFRERTRARFGLPEGEEVDVELVEHEPWTAFNYYQGNLRSRIAVNTDVSLPTYFVAELVAHEAYPGHHTEHAWKEHILVRERGFAEEALFLVATPQALLNEGVATIALETLLGDDEGPVVTACLAEIGVEHDADVSARVTAAREALAYVPGNAALLVHEEGGSADDAVEYVQRWALYPEERARKSVAFITDATWRSYVSTYTSGRRLAQSFVDGDPARFRRLLTEQLTPADLAAGAAA